MSLVVIYIGLLFVILSLHSNSQSGPCYDKYLKRESKLTVTSICNHQGSWGWGYVVGFLFIP